MLLRIKFTSLFLSGLLVLSCSSTKDIPVRGEFTFEFNNEPYEIISVSAPSGEGYNYLIKKEEGKSVFRSLDTNQDGMIDLIQYGSISIDQANKIYAYGIQTAIDQQKFKARESQRIFTFTQDNREYTIQTFGYYIDVLYNMFLITNLKTGYDEVFFDMDADGELDTIEKSDRSLEDVQELYQRIIQAGENKNLIEYRHGKFIVLISSQDQAS